MTNWITRITGAALWQASGWSLVSTTQAMPCRSTGSTAATAANSAG